MGNMMSLHRVARLSLHDKVRTQSNLEGLGIELLQRNRTQNEKCLGHLLAFPLDASLWRSSRHSTLGLPL